MSKRGILSATIGYILWGLFPLYWKQLDHVPAVQILGHRVVWAFLFVCLLLTIQRKWAWLRSLLQQKKRLAILALSAVLLSINWGVFIWAIQNDYVIESSLGYFLNPLLSIALGVVLLGEKLRRLQWGAIGLAFMGVLYLTIQYGQPPWIALLLGGSFALYGYLKKTSVLPSVEGLTMETGFLFLPAVLYLGMQANNGTAHWGTDIETTSFLTFAGVATAIPLLLFAYGAQRIPLALVGILQYIAPTIQFLLGIFVYHEAFSRDQAIGYGLVWLALLLFTAETLYNWKRSV